MKHGEVRRVVAEFANWLADQGIHLGVKDPADGGYGTYPPDETIEELAQRFARERRRSSKEG